MISSSKEFMEYNYHESAKEGKMWLDEKIDNIKREIC